MGKNKKDFNDIREFQHLKEKGEIISNAEYTESILKKTKTPDTLVENKATDLDNIYSPMIAMLSEMEKEYNELVVKEVNEDLSKEAKALRIRISKVRINADKARIGAKAEIIRAGNVIQGAYNTLAFAVTSKEEKLLSIEKYFENLEKERIEKLKEDRKMELELFGLDEYPSDLGNMSEAVWLNYLTGVRVVYDQQIAAEKQAELQRLDAEKAEKERIKKIEAENKRLEKEAKEKDRLNKIEYAKRVEEAKLRLEKEKLEQLEQQKKQDILNAQIEKERLAKEKLEIEIEEKKQAELKAEKERLAKEKTLLLAPDKDKLIKLANDLSSFPMPDLSSEEAMDILADVMERLVSLNIYIKTKSNTL